jgi:hypothetical protein
VIQRWRDDLCDNRGDSTLCRVLLATLQCNAHKRTREGYGWCVKPQHRRNGSVRLHFFCRLRRPVSRSARVLGHRPSTNLPLDYLATRVPYVLASKPGAN